MRRDRLHIAALSLASVLLPGIVSAQALSRVVGVFNIIVGLMLVAAFLLYGTGMLMWFTRLGVFPSYRDEAIAVLEWAVAVLFTLVALLTIVHLIQTHIAAASFLLGVAIVLAVIWFILKVATSSGGEEEGGH